MKILGYTIAMRWSYTSEQYRGHKVTNKTPWHSNKRLYLSEESVDDAIDQMQKVWGENTEFKKLECIINCNGITELI